MFDHLPMHSLPSSQVTVSDFDGCVPKDVTKKSGVQQVLPLQSSKLPHGASTGVEAEPERYIMIKHGTK